MNLWGRTDREDLVAILMRCARALVAKSWAAFAGYSDCAVRTSRDVCDSRSRARGVAVNERGAKHKTPPFWGGVLCKHEEPDDYLLSHGRSALSSAWSRFTVLFGMGRGGTDSLWSSGMTCCCVAGGRHNQSGKKQ